MPRVLLYALIVALIGLGLFIVARGRIAEAPGTVLLFDRFDDASVGLLPQSSPSPSQYTRDYVDGEYRIQVLDPSYPYITSATIPGTYADAVLSVDARLVGEADRRWIEIGCRQQRRSPDSEYRLLVEPEERIFSLIRRDDGTSVRFVDAQPSAAVWRAAGNHLELSCVGDSISARINDTLVAAVRDGTYADGNSWIGFWSPDQTGEVRFDNLEVVQGARGDAPSPTSTSPVAGTVILADDFHDAGDGWLPRVSPNPPSYTLGYVDREYRLQTIDAAYQFVVPARLPGIYADATLAVDARLEGGGASVLFLECRQQRDNANRAYRLALDPTQRRFRLELRGEGDETRPLLDWQTSDLIQSGSNRIELSCVGDTIAASINGGRVPSVRDGTYAQGALEIGAYGDLPDARFANLVVTAG